MSVAPRRATLADVAAATGVSVGTVSKALNNRGQLHADTRARIREAADALGLAAPAGTRGPMPGHPRPLTIGLVTSDDIGRFSIPVTYGLEDAFPADDAAVLLSNSRGDSVRERHGVEVLAARGVDAIMVMTNLTGPRPSLPTTSVPIVYVMGESDDDRDLSVVVDQVQGTLLVLEHLAALGHRDVMSVAGPRHDHSARIRAQTVELHAASFGLRVTDDRSHYGTWTETWGRQAAQMIRRRTGPVDAVVCGSDEIARGVADGLRETDITVPQDVAVVGFDNWGTAALNSRPALTTVDMHLEELGRAAGARVLDALEGRSRPGVEAHPCQLIVRDST